MAFKDTKGKRQMSLIPPNAILEVVKVREFGMKKYPDEDAFAFVDSVPADAFIEAAERHINAYRRGEKLDIESGLSHIDHATSSLLMATEVKLREKDNRTLYGVIKPTSLGKPFYLGEDK